MSTSNTTLASNTTNRRRAIRIQPLPIVLAVLFAGFLLPGCDNSKPTADNGQQGAQMATKTPPPPQNGQAVSVHDELLSVHVKDMPRAKLINEISEATGATITISGGDDNAKITIQVDDASLRHVLSLLAADAMYTATLTHTNLQDSFPEKIDIVENQRSEPTPASPTAPQQADTSIIAPESSAKSESVPETDSDRFISRENLSLDDRMKLLSKMDPEDQMDVVTALDASPSDIPLLNRLVQESDNPEVKEAALNVLQDGERNDVLPAVYTALRDTNADVAIKATEVINFIGTPEDIPILQSVRDSTTDEEVKQSLEDSIELLQPD